MEFSNLMLYGLILLQQLTIIIVLIHMIHTRREPSSMIAWLLFLILLPYIAVILYFLFGTRKVRKKYKKENISINRTKQDSSTDSFDIYKKATNGEMRLYFDYVESFKEFKRSILDSQKSIYICTYIFKYDNVTKEILSLLEQKAKEGVEVKMLLDSLGSLHAYFFQKGFKSLKAAGAEIAFFMPFFHIPFRNYINLRNHRKIYIFDKQKVLSGGINLSNEYFGNKYIKNRSEDILFSCKGPCVEDFFTIFASDWYYVTQQRLNFDTVSAIVEGDEKIKVIPSGPDVKKDVLYGTILDKIFMAKERIWFVTPYFVPNETLAKALTIARHKGVDIKLITPKQSDHIIVDLVRSSFLRELQENDIEIRFHEGHMLHAKAILFDDECSMVGSVNLDNRSLFLNYEVTAFVSSGQSLLTIETWMNGLLRNSTIGIEEASTMRILFENLMRIIAPQL